MKKIILIIAIILFGKLATAQTEIDSNYVDDYGFDALEVMRVDSNGDTKDTTYITYEFMNFVYRHNNCHVDYYRHRYDVDTVLIDSKYFQKPLPMKDIVGEKAIGNHLDDFYSPADSARIKLLFEYMKKKSMIGVN